MERPCRRRRACRPCERARPSQDSEELLLGEHLAAQEAFRESRPGAEGARRRNNSAPTCGGGSEATQQFGADVSATVHAHAPSQRRLGEIGCAYTLLSEQLAQIFQDF